jgi:hypothetical protein
MARDNRENTENTATEVQVTEAPAVAAPAEAKKDERYVMVTRPGTTDLVKRSELIKELWTGATTSNNPTGKKHSRSEIKNIINEPAVRGSNKEIPYQIVFAATKNVAGGPDKTAEAPAAEAPAEQPQD